MKPRRAPRIVIILATAIFGTAFLLSAAQPPSKPSVFDLAGHWEAAVEFGKTKFNLAVRITKLPNGKLEARVDIPEQGAKDIPVNAMLFNYPAVRWEIDPFNTAFNGKLNEAGTEIDGAFEEGPGGRPIAMVFRRVDPSQRVEPKRVFTFAAGEPLDIRGYWHGTIESPPGTQVRIGLKIGRSADGSFGAKLDLLDQGATDLPASAISYTNSVATLEWKLLQLVFIGKLDNGGAQLAGDWKQRGKPTPVTFQRLEQPATLLPANISFTPKENAPDDIRGHWSGALNIQGNKLRIVFKVGQTPDGTFAGSLGSPDQGANEVPITSVGYTNPVVRLESKGIRGVFTGRLDPDGKSIDGFWEQGGGRFDLKLARMAEPAGSKAP